MKLSIVSTLFMSASYIDEFHERASLVARNLVGKDYEIIFVNDGSPDNSLSVAIELSEKDEHVAIIDLSRNFGHHKAMMTGLNYAEGEKIFLIDSDLEEEPEWLIDFDKQMDVESCDVVYGVQEKRKGKLLNRWSGGLFWNLFIWFSGSKLPKNIVTARLMRKQFVEALLMHKEREVFIAGLWFITGFKQNPHIVRKLVNSTTTTYTLSRKITLFIDSITSFSNLPLVSIFYMGLIIFLSACLYTTYLVFNWYLFSIPLVGWTSVMASIWLLGGLVISFIGVIGIYLSKIFSETKQRPYSIVKKVYGRK